MAAFPAPIDALNCAISIERDFAEYNDEHREEPLRVRVGLHTGMAIKEADDFYGRAVNLAARITGEAQGGGILVSERLKELTEDLAEFALRRVPGGAGEGSARAGARVRGAVAAGDVMELAL